MLNIRKSDDRGLTGAYWLKSQHSFSFSEYYDPKFMGFGPLRVINEDWVRAQAGFDMHGHKNMEIITYILSGELSHKDSLGTGSTIRPGEVQVMSAGKGILHSEMNNSPDQDVHLLQIWIMPNETGTRPGYQQHAFDPAEMQNNFRLLVSPTGENGSLVIKQDAKLFAAKIDAGKTVNFATDASRKYWLQVARGSIDIAGQTTEAGDGIAIEKETMALIMTAATPTEVLLFDLPQ